MSCGPSSLLVDGKEVVCQSYGAPGNRLVLGSDENSGLTDRRCGLFFHPFVLMWEKGNAS